MSLDVRWVSAFVDAPPDRFDAAASFWSSVTGSAPGPPVGDHGEFLPLEPPEGHPCLWLQRLRSGSMATHPDLCVEGGVVAAARTASDLGATRLDRTEGLEVLRSPGGLPFCLV